MAAYESVTVEFELDVWTDVTERVDGLYTISSGATAEASVNPGGVALPVRNHDQWATPGNPVSPLAPYLKPGMRCRIKDAPADQETALFTGYLAYPEAESWTESTAENPREQTVRLPFVDLVSFVEDSRTLADAYTEYVIHNGRGDLKGFWPLTQERAPLLGVGPITAPMTVTNTILAPFHPAAKEQLKAGDAPPALESNGLRCQWVPGSTPGSADYNWVKAPELRLPTEATETVTIMFWLNQTDISNLGFQEVMAFYMKGTVSGSVLFRLLVDPNTGVWSLEASTDQTGVITAGPVGKGALLPVAVRYRGSPATMELWIGSQRLSTTLTGTAPADMYLLTTDFGWRLGTYDLSGVAVYIGQTWGYTDYLALIQHAYTPLERQTTGQRIRTALAWAGIDVPMHRISPGVSVMQSVRTAGRKASDLIADAVATEQGDYYADGDGLPVFDDRTTLFNV